MHRWIVVCALLVCVSCASGGPAVSQVVSDNRPHKLPYAVVGCASKRPLFELLAAELLYGAPVATVVWNRYRFQMFKPTGYSTCGLIPRVPLTVQRVLGSFNVDRPMGLFHGTVLEVTGGVPSFTYYVVLWEPQV